MFARYPSRTVTGAAAPAAPGLPGGDDEQPAANSVPPTATAAPARILRIFSHSPSVKSAIMTIQPIVKVGNTPAAPATAPVTAPGGPASAPGGPSGAVGGVPSGAVGGVLQAHPLHGGELGQALLQPRLVGVRGVVYLVDNFGERRRQRHSPGYRRRGDVRQPAARGAHLQPDRDRRAVLEGDQRLLLAERLVELRAPGHAQRAGQEQRDGGKHDTG